MTVLEGIKVRGSSSERGYCYSELVVTVQSQALSINAPAPSIGTGVIH